MSRRPSLAVFCLENVTRVVSEMAFRVNATRVVSEMALPPQPPYHSKSGGIGILLPNELALPQE